MGINGQPMNMRVINEWVPDAHKRTLDLARVKQGMFMASATAYKESEQIELVQVMLGELEKLYMVLTQSIQREGMRLNIKMEKMIDTLIEKKEEVKILKPISPET